MVVNGLTYFEGTTYPANRKHIVMNVFCRVTDRQVVEQRHCHELQDQSGLVCGFKKIADFPEQITDQAQQPAGQTIQVQGQVDEIQFEAVKTGVVKCPILGILDITL